MICAAAAGCHVVYELKRKAEEVPRVEKVQTTVVVIAGRSPINTMQSVKDVEKESCRHPSTFVQLPWTVS
jgi:AmiR/NasT family two-component response regulator